MRYATLCPVLIALVGCGKEKAPPAEAPPAAVARAATVALADLQHLRYLDGNWRGQGATGAAFFERYVVANDSVILSYTFSDSTFKAIADSGAIRWSNSQVRSGTRWVATLWSPDSVRFTDVGNPGNSFVWVRQSPDTWQARLEPSPSSPPTVYAMTRVKN